MQNKVIKTLALALVAAAFWLFVNGCGSGASVKTLTNGYEEVTSTHSSFLSEPITQKTKLGYKNAEGKRMVIWPVVRSGIFIRDGVAVFIGDRSIRRSKLDQTWEIETRIFAVRAPEPPVDITTIIIRQWAEESGKDVSKALAAAALIGGKETGDGKLDFYFEFNAGIWPGEDILLNWDQVSAIHKQESKDGIQRKDPEFGAIYLEKKSEVEVQR